MANDNKELEGYEFFLKVLTILSIKPRLSGDFKNDKDETVEYGYAVKFKSVKIDLVKDKDFGEVEQEKIIEVEISCDTKAETQNLNDHLKVLKDAKIPFVIDISQTSRDGQTTKIKTITKGRDFITNNPLK